MRAYELLFEATTPHLQHLEDLVLDDGYNGAVSAIKLSDNIRIMMSRGRGKKSKVTVKYDGSPAIFVGIDPVDGKFFVGTKAVLSKNPKMIKQPADLKKFYGDVPDLAKKLAIAYKYLKPLGIKNILQGDLMFTEDSLSHQSIDGEDYLTFTPNLITYAVLATSDLAKKIEQAKFGIVFHTAYDGGESIGTAEKTFNINISKLKKSSNIWFDDATYKDYTGIASLTPEEDEFLRQEIIAAKARLTELGKSELDNIVHNSEFKKHIQVFINRNVRAGEHIKDSAKFTNEFMKFYTERTLAGVEELKPTFQVKRHQKIKDKQAFIQEHQESIYKLIDLYNHLNEIKLLLISKLNTLDSMKTFIKSGTGYDITNPEGFVAVGHTGNAVKLVNRLEFSKQNFQKQN